MSADGLTLPVAVQANRVGQQQTDGAKATAFATVLSPAPHDVWRNLIQADADAVPYQSWEWTQAACATGKYIDVSRLYTTHNGAQFILPLIARAGRPRWACVAASMPNAWGMGGLIGSEPLTQAIVNGIVGDLRGLGYLGINLRPNPLHAELWASVSGLATPRRAHAIDLRDGFDAAWMRFSSRVRTMVRNAERDVEIEFDDTGRLLPVFYGLFEKSVERWARTQHEPLPLARWRANRRDPLDKFEHIARAMPGSCRIGVARREGHPVAAILVLQGQNANYSRGAMDAELIGNSGANELLHRYAIEDAANAGCHTYHMGESGSSTSLARFKEKLGATAYDYAEYRLEAIPLARMERAVKGLVKRLIGFKDGQ